MLNVITGVIRKSQLHALKEKELLQIAHKLLTQTLEKQEYVLTMFGLYFESLFDETASV